MIQRQIVKSLTKQIDIEDPDGMKYAITSFYYLDWMFVSVNVTTYRTVPLLQKYQSSNSHCIMMMTPELRSSI